MNAYELLNPDGKPSGVWTCENCRKVGYTQEYVNQCCVCHYCHKVVPYDPQVRRACHEACLDQDRQKRLEEQISKAEKVTNWNGPVFWEAAGGNEGFFESMDELLETLYESVNDGYPHDDAEDVDLSNWPAFVFVAEHEGVHIPGVEQIIEWTCEDGFDGMDEHIQGLKELETALAAFRDANKGLYMYTIDTKRVVAVPAYEAPAAPSQPSPAS